MANAIMTTLSRDRWTFILGGLLIAILRISGTSWTLSLLGGLMVLAPLLFQSMKREKRGSASQGLEQLEVQDRLANVRAGMAAIDSPVFVLDKNANVLSENPAAARVFGQIEKGQHISARLRSPDILDIIRDTISTGRPNQIEHVERLPAESFYLVRIALGQADIAGQGFYVLSFRDISEAHRIDRMRSDFVANASHELRTPLASLRGFIETMQGPAKNDEVAREKFLTIMAEQVTRMSRLVDDLLSLSRLELKERIPPEDRVDLGEVIGSVIDSLAPMAEALEVDINFVPPATPVTVTGDRDELTEVFENLIENACKYGQSGRIVDVTISGKSSNPIEVHVRDHGPGIAPEHVPRLTERFYRVNVEHSRSKKGTGLGLAIVKHILARHRARLIIRSELGKGSVFSVRF